MNKSLRTLIISFFVILTLFVLFGLLGQSLLGQSFTWSYILGSLIISTFLSIISFAISKIFYNIKAKWVKSKANQILPTPPTADEIVNSKKLNLSIKISILLILLLVFVGIFKILPRSGDRAIITKEAIPKINIITKSPAKVDGIKGVPTIFSGVSFDSSTFIVTFDNGVFYVYRLKGGKSNLIQGLPSTFYSYKFYPTGKGLFFMLWPSENSQADIYLIKDDKAVKVLQDYPGELYLDKIFGDGEVKIGLIDNDNEKKLYFLKDSELFNPIDIHQIKYPEIVIVDNVVHTNSIIPITYLIFESGGIFFINDQNTSLQNVYSDSGTKIEGVWSYNVFKNALWIITQDDEKGLLWKLDKDKATFVTDFSLDYAYYDSSSGKPYPEKIIPEIEIVNDLLIVNTGRNRYLLDENKLRHIHNIKYGYVRSGVLAQINDSLYAACSDSSYDNFRICQYNLKQDPIEEKYIGTIRRNYITSYKSVYDGQYYIEGSSYFMRTKYYHLTDGRLAEVDSDIRIILANESKFILRGDGYTTIDLIREGEVIRYQIPKKNIFFFNSLGSDEGGVYYTVYKKGKGTSTFLDIYYLSK